MFLKVNASDITICINLGSDLSQAENLVKMFEQNAVFVREDYRGLSVADVESTIVLGDKVEFTQDSYSEPKTNLIVSSDSELIGAVNADANVFADIERIKTDAKKQIESMRQRVELANKEADIVRQELEDFKEQIALESE